jgi:hypothetical protein
MKAVHGCEHVRAEARGILGFLQDLYQRLRVLEKKEGRENDMMFTVSKHEINLGADLGLTWLYFKHPTILFGRALFDLRKSGQCVVALFQEGDTRIYPAINLEARTRRACIDDDSKPACFEPRVRGDGRRHSIVRGSRG